jgi:hypothetical protein
MSSEIRVRRGRHSAYRVQAGDQQRGKKAVRWGHTCSDGTTALVRVGYDCAKCCEPWPVNDLRSLKERAAAQKPYGRILVRAGDVIELCRRAGL